MNRPNPSRCGRLIVNADDFGLSPEVNEGILEAFERGILTSASLIPTGEAFQQAVRMVRENPSLGVGIHLTLIGENSVLEKREIPTLVDGDGKFRPTASRFFSDYIRDRISMDDVEKELRAQFEKILSHGITISHIDSHQHIHMLPKILDITIQLARDHNVRFIRNPKEKIRVQYLASFRKYPRLVQQIILNLFCFYAKERLEPFSTDCFYGFFYGGNLDKHKLKRILLEHPNDSIGEIMCHPGKVPNGNTIEKYSRWNYQWGRELEGLTDPVIRKLVKENNILMSSFHDIGHG